MAEEVKSPVAADAPKVAEEETRVAEAPAATTVAESEAGKGGDAAVPADVAEGELAPRPGTC